MKVCLKCNNKFDNLSWECPICHFSPEYIHGFPAFSPSLAENNDGFNPSSFEKLASLEARNFWFRSRNRLIFWALRKHFSKATRFLEIGCGTGYVSSGIEKEFPEMSLCGSEIYSTGLTFAAQRLRNASLFQMDARCIPFEREFDVICAFDVLEHIEEDEKVLAEMFKAVKPGGGIIITVPQHKFLWSRTDERACHVRRYSSTELEGKVKKAGLVVECMTSFVTLLFPLMILSRINKRDKEGRTGGELELNANLNRIFERIMDFERGILKFCSLPFGGSLLLIARRDGDLNW